MYTFDSEPKASTGVKSEGIKSLGFLIFEDLSPVILSYQEKYPWVPIQPHTLAEETHGYNSLL